MDVRPVTVASEVVETILGVPRPGSVPLQLDSDIVLNTGTLDAVFRAPIRTVKSIPRGCRLAFSYAFKASLLKVAAEPNLTRNWVHLLLLPRCTLRVFRPQGRAECRSGNRKATQQTQILRALATWGESGGTQHLIKEVLQIPRPGGFRGVDADAKEIDNMLTNILTCLRKVADGHFTAAVKAISSSGLFRSTKLTKVVFLSYTAGASRVHFH
ncbi:hypothetical protein MKW98_000624 [Papaver atlanticum]|uniref:Uncharacterized protein n=1 Tax=Papaver atlanticum TaxID=357466 RepID=A0AAD4X8T7_9MAGN|nr:hypothetical protein MKW98_000624 [Papaver atlanticum]